MARKASLPTRKSYQPQLHSAASNGANYAAITRWREDRIRELAALESSEESPDRDLARKAKPLIDEATRWKASEDLKGYVAAVMARVPASEAAQSWERFALAAAEELSPMGLRIRLLQTEATSAAPVTSCDRASTKDGRRHTLKDLLKLSESAGTDFEQGFRYLHHFAKNGPYETPPVSFSEFLSDLRASPSPAIGSANDRTIQRSIYFLNAIARGTSADDAMSEAWSRHPLGLDA